MRSLLPWPSSLNTNSRLFPSPSFLPRRLFFPPFPNRNKKYSIM